MTIETSAFRTPSSPPRRPWRWLKLALPALALSGVFATTALARGPGGPGGPGGKQGEQFMERRMDRMLGHVKATPEQETTIKAIVASHKEQLKDLHKEKRALHEAARAVLVAPTIDATAVEGVRSKMTAQADKRSRIVADMALQIGQVLTQAQRQQMAEHMGRGRGGPRRGGPLGF